MGRAVRFVHGVAHLVGQPPEAEAADDEEGATGDVLEIGRVHDEGDGSAEGSREQEGQSDFRPHEGGRQRTDHGEAGTRHRPDVVGCFLLHALDLGGQLGDTGVLQAGDSLGFGLVGFQFLPGTVHSGGEFASELHLLGVVDGVGLGRPGDSEGDVGLRRGGEIGLG